MQKVLGSSAPFQSFISKIQRCVKIFGKCGVLPRQKDLGGTCFDVAVYQGMFPLIGKLY